MPAPNERAAWSELARSAAQHGDETVAEELRQLLAFEVAGGRYALAVECVREIVRLRPITPIPRAPADVRGVISLRGEIVQVVDMRRRLSAETAEPTRRSRIIVVQSEEAGIAGLLVDSVREVLRISSSDLASSASADVGMVAALCRRGGSFVSLIDLERVLDLHAGH
jgi:purine-binding chemotaxis protein CheW